MKITEEVFKKWVEEYLQDLTRWATYQVKDPYVADDLVQDTFLAAWDSRDKFRGDSKPHTWLFAILKNKIMDHHRRKFRNPEQSENTGSVNEEGDGIIDKYFDENGMWQQNTSPSPWDIEEEENLLDNVEFLNLLHLCIDNLPDKWNTAIKMKYISGKKGQEISQALNITTTNYWQIIHRAKFKIRECLDNDWFNKK